jgi:hypothetical protein
MVICLKNYFSQLLKVNIVSDVWHIEIYTVEPFMSDPSILG